MTDLETFAFKRCGSVSVEDMLKDAAENEAIVLPGSARFIALIVEGDCWRDILRSTSYPHMFALHVLRALPKENPTVSPAWALFEQWAGVSDSFLTGLIHRDRTALIDVLFGPYWRVFLGPEAAGLIPLYRAMIRNKPAFAEGLLPEIARDDRTLPSLG